MAVVLGQPVGAVAVDRARHVAVGGLVAARTSAGSRAPRPRSPCAAAPPPWWRRRGSTSACSGAGPAGAPGRRGSRGCAPSRCAARRRIRARRPGGSRPLPSRSCQARATASSAAAARGAAQPADVGCAGCELAERHRELHVARRARGRARDRRRSAPDACANASRTRVRGGSSPRTRWRSDAALLEGRGAEAARRIERDHALAPVHHDRARRPRRARGSGSCRRCPGTPARAASPGTVAAPRRGARACAPRPVFSTR